MCNWLPSVKGRPYSFVSLPFDRFTKYSILSSTVYLSPRYFVNISFSTYYALLINICSYLDAKQYDANPRMGSQVNRGIRYAARGTVLPVILSKKGKSA